VISRFFIDRPIFASVVSAFIVIAGLAAIRALPVAAYPDILPPEVEVSAFYPGANSATVAETVAAPLEQQINGVDGMLYLRSASAGNGSLSITVTFAIGTDPDLATINVDNRVQAALATLPEEVRRQGVTVRKRSSTILQIATIGSTDPRHDQIYVSNYASFNVIDELRRIPGVGDAQNFTAKDYSIRVWMRPDRMAQLGLTPSGRRGCDPRAERAVRRGPRWPGADPRPGRFHLLGDDARPAREPGAVRRDHPAHYAGWRVRETEGRRARRARLARLRLRRQAQRQAHGADRHLPAAGCKCARSRRCRQGQARGAHQVRTPRL
jgi:hypothetical protein